MPSQTRPSFYTLTTTHGHQATIYAAPDADPWQVATQYARALLESNSHLAELRIASEAEIAAFRAQLEGVQPAPSTTGGTTPESGSDVALNQHPLPSTAADHLPPARGFKLNLHPSPRAPRDHPAWANGLQQETWRSRSLVVWDNMRRCILGLPAGEAVGLLAFMRVNDVWQIDGIQVGPTNNFSPLDDPNWQPEAVTRDAILLDAADALQLFSLLQHNQQALHQIAEDQQRQARHALSQVYDLLLDDARRARARRAQEEDSPQSEADTPESPSGPSPTAA